MSRTKTPQPGGSAASSVYRHLWESSLDACFLLHCERDGAGHITDFVFTDMNPRGAAALGLAKEAAMGRNLCEVVPIQRGGGLYNRYVKVAESGATLDEECDLNLAEIDARWIRQQVIATPDGIAIIARDITARKLEEFASRQNGAFLQALIDSLPVLISVRSVRPGTSAISSSGTLAPSASRATRRTKSPAARSRRPCRRKPIPAWIRSTLMRRAGRRLTKAPSPSSGGMARRGSCVPLRFYCRINTATRNSSWASPRISPSSPRRESNWKGTPITTR